MKRAILFLLGFVGVSLALNLALPVTFDDEIPAKLSAFMSQKDQITTLFLGTSQFWRGIDPRRFDQVLETHGLASTSYNLGINRLSVFEAEVLLEKILKARPAKLKQIVFDGRMGLGWDDEAAFSALERDVYWRSLSLGWTDVFFRLKAVLQLKNRDSVIYLSRAIASTVEKAVNHGRLRTLLQSAPPIDAGLPVTFSGEFRGFKPLDGETDAKLLSMRKIMLERWPEFVERVKRASESQIPPVILEEDPAGARFSRLVELARSHGLEVAVVTVPSPTHAVFPVQECMGRGSPCRWVDFSQGPGFPELYKPEYFYDFYHLNQRGAEVYSGKLAEELIR